MITSAEFNLNLSSLPPAHGMATLISLACDRSILKKAVFSTKTATSKFQERVSPKYALSTSAKLLANNKLLIFIT